MADNPKGPAGGDFSGGSLEADEENMEEKTPASANPRKRAYDDDDDEDFTPVAALTLAALGGEVVTKDIKKRTKKPAYDDDDEEYEEIEKHRSKKTQKGGRRYAIDNDDDEDADDLDGEVKTSGRVMKVYCENFMNHRKFSLKFGKHVNFVTGPNGSGKSAIVAALQLCLGSKMSHTGRGSAMAGLIREGSPGPAIVRVSLLNSGPDAYKQDLYGELIIVERTITRQGIATYKLLGVDFICKSREKRELDNILKSFAIYCENPCCVLTQEQSKKFISGTETDKYDFFLKATGLEMTLKELEVCSEQMKETELSLAGGQAKLAGMLERLRFANGEVEKFKQFDKLEANIQGCVMKRFWVDFHLTADVIKEVETQLCVKTQAHATVTEDLKAAEAENNEIQDLSKIHDEINSINEQQQSMVAELTEKEKEIKLHGRELPILQARVKTMSLEQRENEMRLIRVSDEITSLKSQALSAAKANEKGLLDSIQERLKSIETLEAREIEIQGLYALKTSARDAENHKRHDFMPYVRNVENSIRKTRGEIDQFSGQTQDRSALFHPMLPQILNKLRNQKANAFRQEWLGPAGMYIKVKEGCSSPFGQAIEKGLKIHLTSFVVSCKEDQNLISEIIFSCGKEAASQIKVVSQPARARHTSDRINKISGGLSLSEAIIVENDMIYNMLIDQVGIDKILLSPSEGEVENNFIIRNSNGRKVFRDNISQAILKDGVIIRYRDGNMARDSNRDHFKRALSEDMAQVVSSLQERLQLEIGSLKAARDDQARCESAIDMMNRDIKVLESDLKKTTETLRGEQRSKLNLETDLEKIQEAGKINTSPLEDEASELKEAIEAFSKELALAKIACENAEFVKRTLASQKTTIQKTIDDLRKAEEGLQDKLDRFLNRRASIQQNVDRCIKKLEIAQRAVLDTQSILDTKKEQLQEKHKIAQERTMKYLESKNLPWDGKDVLLAIKETDDYLKKCIESLEKKLEEGKKSVGLGRVTREQAISNFVLAENVYQKHKGEVEDLQNRVADLKKDIRQRTKRWLAQRDDCSHTVDIWFDRYLNKKGSSGTVEFDYDQRRLKMKVQTDNFDDLTECNDVKSLSGGERSFTTLCLLMALGHVIDTPFRILDEYDVYMDEKVRKITLDTIKEHALRFKDNREQQFIIITPNNLDGIVTSDEVRIHRMQKPNRESSVGLSQMTLDS